MTIALASFARQKRVQKFLFPEVKIQKATDFFMHKGPLCAFTPNDLFSIKWKDVRKNKHLRPQVGVHFTLFFLEQAVSALCTAHQTSRLHISFKGSMETKEKMSNDEQSPTV